MAEDEKSSEGTKTLKLGKARARVPALTSLGTFFARHMSGDDIKSFSEYVDGKSDKATTDLRGLGERALRVLVCAAEEDDRTPALTEQVYAQLTSEDVRVLTHAVSQACRVPFAPGDDPVKSLGEALFDRMAEQARSLAEIAAAMQKTLDSGFGSIPASMKAAVGESLAGLSSIRSMLSTSSAVEAARLAQQQDQAAIFGRFSQHVNAGSAAAEALQKMKEQLVGAHAWDSAAAGMVPPGLSEVAGEQRLNVVGMPKEGVGELNERRAEARLDIPDHLLQPVRMPPVEETPIGRAAIAGEKSALQLQEVAGLIGQMTEQLGGLHQLFFAQVIPQWVKNLEDSGAKAGESILLAKKAIYWSIFVTVAVTLVQLAVAHFYRSDDDEQQKASKALLQQQLNASLDLNRQLAADSKRLQDELAKLRSSVSALQASMAPREPSSRSGKP